MEKQRKNTVQSAAKLFRVLEVLAENEGRMKLSELVRAMDVPASTAHRLVSSLYDLGYVNKDNYTGEYTLGLRILSLASVVLKKLDLRRVAYPFLEKLRDKVGETANLVVLDGDEVLYIEKVESRATIRAFSLIGKRAPVHATAAGKVLLADMAWPDVLAILEKRGMPKLTEKTVTNPKVLMEKLYEANMHGYSLDNEECELEVVCIAAPVRNHSGKTVASLSVSGPKDRIYGENFQQYIGLIKGNALEISKALGYNGNASAFM